MDLPPDIFSLDEPVVLFPVRHHSPTAALMVSRLIERLKPVAVLIEGPSDFNDRLHELDLPHELPIAIYSYLRLPDDSRRGGYYPFCIYSPEWQALLAARRCGAHVRFIDLPYADIAASDTTVNLYADADFRRSQYVRRLCKKLGVDSFNTVWDTFFELDRSLTPETYLARAHLFCGQMRLIEGESRKIDQRREAFMATQITAARETHAGQIIVVTGGYHSLGIHARIHQIDDPVLAGPAESEPGAPAAGEERGIAITPYSYERLDGLTGYDAGMPNPGYYHRMWQDRQAGRPIAHRKLMFDVARTLRDRKQRVSSADLIAAESCASALARLRGHGEVWRTDLVDGMIGALIKDELSAGTHPLLDAVHEVLRGNARGQLARGAAIPPLVHDLRRRLADAGLAPEQQGRQIDLDLCSEAGREQSRLLHRITILGIAGYTRVAGTDFTSRADLTRLWETWKIQWSPEFESSAIEAARYGATLAEAAANRLAEKAKSIARNASQGARLLVEASLAGLNSIASALHARLLQIVNADGEFLSVATALSHLLYLYQFDEAMGTQGRADVGGILTSTFGRGLWLLEILGQMSDPDGQTVRGVSTLLDTFERCERPLQLNREEFLGILTRVAQDRSQGAAVRGAAMGSLWVLGQSHSDQVRAELKMFADPQLLGDFLTGLFAIGREVVQREEAMILAIDTLLAGYADEDFLVALPSLRLAFTYFTPREKHHMATSLLTALGIKDLAPMAALAVRPEDATRAIARESALFAALAKYGLRGGDA